MVTMASSAPSNIATTPSSPDVSTTTLPKKSSENKRSNKPIMEKRRRARINNSLNELKTLILDAMKKDPSRHTKLEKADILEMTVKHLASLHKEIAISTGIGDKYRAGFNECTNEVNRFPGLEPLVRRRLLEHLNRCLNTPSPSSSPPTRPMAPNNDLMSRVNPPPNVQVQILPGDNPAAANGRHNGIFLTGGANGGGLQLVPTRLPNGDIALVLPTNSAHAIQQRLAASPTPSATSSCSPPPLAIIDDRRRHHHSSRSASADSTASSNSPIAFDRLSVNIPTGASSSCDDTCPSPSSVHSNYSSPRSPGMAHHRYENRAVYSPPLQKPLALVVRDGYWAATNDDKPWRPW